MPVGSFENQAFIGTVKQKPFFLFTIMIIDSAGTFNADSRLESGFVTVPSALNIIHPIDIKNPFYIKWNYFIDHGKITSFIGKCC